MKQKITIAFSPDVSRELGNDIEAALFYQQIYYWSDKGDRDDGFIYKTKGDIENETTLSIKQQDRVRKKLEKLGWIETKKCWVKGAPVLHYLPKMALTLNMTKGQIPMLQKGTLEHDKREDSSISKITTKNTSDSLSEERSPNLNKSISKVIERFATVSPKAKKMYMVPSWRTAAAELIEYAGSEEAALKFIDEFVQARKANMLYLPVVESLVQMADRFASIGQIIGKEKGKNGGYNPKGNSGYKYQDPIIVKLDKK